MDALSLLHNRNSAPRLTEPAPSGEELENMIKAGLRAPDHAWLRPWRFLTISGSAREKLGELLIEATDLRQRAAGGAAMSAQERQKLAAKPLRAPLIIVVIASLTEHPKVPVVEQLLSAGCAAHGILLAAQAQGYAGIWRTGTNSYDSTVKQGLGLSDSEEIIGFLYLGSVEGGNKPIPELKVEHFTQSWGES